MLSPNIRVLNFDNSLLGQNNLLARFHPEIVDLTDLGCSSRLWLNSKNTRKVESRIDPLLRNSITFLGSGDFHHISGLLVKQFTEPINLVVFDNHPDWDILPPGLGCGSWVSFALKQPNIRNCLILGASSGDISAPSIYSGNLSSLKDNRVQIYPYSHPPTNVFLRKVPENKSIKIERTAVSTRIDWREFKGGDLREFFLPVFRALSVKKTYISIDKDCLKAGYALTNWEEGNLELTDLLAVLGLIKENLDICGVDVTGEYSSPRAQGLLRNAGMSLDHPRDFSAKDKETVLINSLNGKTNLAIIERLLS